MLFALKAFIMLYIFTTGRRIFALRAVRAAAEALGATAVVARVDAALAHDLETRQLDLAWTGRSATGPAVEVDNRMDRALTGLRDGAQALTAGAREDEPIHRQVDVFLGEVFPGGVKTVTQLPFVDELAAVEAIVDRLQGPLATQVSELGLTRYAQRVIELAVEYRAALEAGPTGITFEAVRVARERGQNLLLGVVATILATYHDPDDPAHAAAREQLLMPIVEQNEAIRVYRQGRRATVVDIDPDTGEEDTGEELEADPDALADDADDADTEAPANGSPAAAAASELSR